MNTIEAARRAPLGRRDRLTYYGLLLTQMRMARKDRNFYLDALDPDKRSQLHTATRALLDFVEHLETKHADELPTAVAQPMAVPEHQAAELRTRRGKYDIDVLSPSVVRGFFKETPAVRKWTRDFFIEQCGETRLHMVQGRDSADDDKLYKVERVASVAEFLAEDSDELYLSNSSDIFAHHPELMDDLDIKRLSKPFPGYIHYQSDIHVARTSKNRANMHCAPGLNLFAQIVGRKRWTFVAPEWTPFVYPLANELPFYGMSIWGEENAQRYPLLARVPRLDVVLEPGDLLLSPPWWWHLVENLDDFTVGVANRGFLPPHQFVGTNLGFSLTGLLRPRTMLSMARHSMPWTHLPDDVRYAKSNSMGEAR